MLVLLLLLALLVGVSRVTTASESIESGSADAVLAAARSQGITGAQALAGARIYAESGCGSCHTYAGTGSANLGAPDLTAEGAKGKGIRFQMALLRCPSCVRTDSAMPSFAALGPAKLRRLAVFLEASRGTR